MLSPRAKTHNYLDIIVAEQSVKAHDPEGTPSTEPRLVTGRCAVQSTKGLMDACIQDANCDFVKHYTDRLH